MNGSCLIALVYEILNTEDCVLNMIAKFCEDNISSEIIHAVTKYITRAYCRMRGKDFARKLMSRDTKSLKQTRRPTLAAVSDPATHHAKRRKKVEGIDSEESNKEIEYLLFDAATGNSSTEEKGSIDDDNLLET